MVWNRFDIVVGIRLVFLIATLTLLVWLFVWTDYFAASLVIGTFAAVQGWSLFRAVRRTNEELARFMLSVRHDDFSQNFETTRKGQGFEELTASFSDLMNRLRLRRSADAEVASTLGTLVEHVPVALIRLSSNGRVELLNSASRRLLGAAQTGSIDDLAAFGEGFIGILRSIRAGEERVVKLVGESGDRHIKASATEIISSGASHKIISLQSIDDELAQAQLGAWHDLVRVLTHEMMNSLTPVASLSGTAVDLVSDLKDKVSDPDLKHDADEVLTAIETLHRRSRGLIDFVESYKRLTRVPAPRVRMIDIGKLFSQCANLTETDLKEQGISLDASVIPSSLQVSADPDLLEQALLNLILNAADAAKGAANPHINLGAGLDSDGYTVISVSDNGPGFDPKTLDHVFVPFYTTKPTGSGIGLSLTRQIALSHRGRIKIGNRPGGGAKVSISLS